MNSIKDLIYFDYDKAKSLNSQLNGGIVNELTRAIEEENETGSQFGIDIKVIKGHFGEKEKGKTFKTEKIELYHELLNDIEKSLFEKKILTDINNAFEYENSSFNDFMKKVPNFTYVKSTGWSAFEDFDRFKRIMNNFNEIQRLIFASVLQTNSNLSLLKEQIIDLKKEIKLSPKSNKSQEFKKLQAIEKNFDKIIEKEVGTIFLDQIFIERLESFLNTFSPKRLNFRLAPFDLYNNFQILANLKSEYLVNGDFENVIFTYGSRPNIKLSIMGIVTSCPMKQDSRVNLNDEFIGFEEDELQNEERFEKALRSVFSSFEAFEKFFFVPSFPKISVSPIAIYREVNYD